MAISFQLFVAQAIPSLANIHQQYLHLYYIKSSLQVNPGTHKVIRLGSLLETFMGLDQRTGAGSNPCISRVVSKSDSDHGTATTATEPLG